jgi:hypothetical protein
MSLGRKILLALFGCLLAAPLSAQSTGTVAGRVVEGANQEPLGGVAVSVAQRTAVTGADGRFSIPGVPAGTQTVQATRIGFAAARREITVVAGQTTTVDLSLGSQALLLEEVVACWRRWWPSATASARPAT